MKVLICESEEVLLTAIEFRLKKQGYDVKLCKHRADLPVYLTDSPDLVLIDLDTEGGIGLDMIREVRKEAKNPPEVLLLADPDEEEAILEGFQLGISDFLSKPFKPAELILRVRRILPV